MTKWCEEGQLTETMQAFEYDSRVIRQHTVQSFNYVAGGAMLPDISKQSIREQICQLLGNLPPQATQ